MTFDELDLPPSLARALKARGYDTPTSVQAAVLDPATGERDLIVSSQTGSGKTIAFGAALARTLLADPTKKAQAGGKPVVLVIVPTRELAAQVREELGWLLAGTGLRLGAFTGGTAVSGDLRALSRGVDLVVGTPGRLVDLLRRERLDLAQLQVVVLDEADEMLDLGFREDLELLLKTAPVERRTLMLSATLPSEIRGLARKYQRDALAIDPRKAARTGSTSTTATFEPAGARAGHDDITYVAHLIAGGDRLGAVVNVLLASEAARVIIFVTTREAVGALHQSLVARGFSATAISGDRAQAERDRALDLVRRGEVRVLVATNVAARGLHLPDVDLIIHADLPLNTESLTHRSGRTGRAGRKGVAVVIATLAERRKAERLLAGAQVRVPWTTPPSSEDIAAAARERLVEELMLAEPPADAAATAHAAEIVARLDGQLAADELARRLLARELGRVAAGETLQKIHLSGAGSDRNGPGPGGDRLQERRSPADLSRDAVMFRINIGGKDRADPRWLLPLICRRGGVTRREVGAIRIGPNETLFEIAGGAARDFALAASERDPRAPHVRVEPVEAQDAGDQPERQDRQDRQDRQGQDRDARPERPERPERPQRAERPQQAERAQRAERPAQAERAERPERPQQPERAERPERPAPVGGGAASQGHARLERRPQAAAPRPPALGPRPHAPGPRPHAHAAGPRPHAHAAGPRPHAHAAGPRPHSPGAHPRHGKPKGR